MVECGFDDPDAWIDPGDFEHDDSFGEIEARELDMWTEMMGPGTSFPGEDDHEPERPPTADPMPGSVTPLAHVGSPTTPLSSPARRPLHRQVSQESTRSHRSGIHAGTDPYGSPMRGAGFSSSSGNGLLPIVLPSVQTPEPAVRSRQPLEVTPVEKGGDSQARARHRVPRVPQQTCLAT